ncbi:MAG: hypothetical protein Ct9H90mP3_2400 [Flammeovirgaceae bacterium]|nr:MAG: hypothetical protein Ct9H90mP3_2400 [Flammeovirgaceae bacterium]
MGHHMHVLIMMHIKILLMTMFIIGQIKMVIKDKSQQQLLSHYFVNRMFILCNYLLSKLLVKVEQLFYKKGKLLDARWKRGSNLDPFHIVDSNNNILYVPKGKVWISLVPNTKNPSFG